MPFDWPNRIADGAGKVVAYTIIVDVTKMIIMTMTLVIKENDIACQKL